MIKIMVELKIVFFAKKMIRVMESYADNAIKNIFYLVMKILV